MRVNIRLHGICGERIRGLLNNSVSELIVDPQAIGHGDNIELHGQDHHYCNAHRDPMRIVREPLTDAIDRLIEP